MKQLAGSDSYWLHSERGNVYNHVGVLGIYDPSTAAGGAVRFDDILRYFECRLDRSPVFRRRLAPVPNDVDRPYWLDDPVFDLEFHVRHIALPEPGDWRQLMIQTARIHSRPLDRSRPLWEAYVIEGLHRIPGLPPGSFAIQMKFHHASVDGQAGVQLLRAIHSETADPDRPDLARPVRYLEREPTAIELYSRAVVHSFERVLGAGTLTSRTVTKIGALLLGGAARRLLPSTPPQQHAAGLPSFRRAPRTRFNRPLSANRTVEAVSLPLAPMKALCARFDGVTINDVFLTVVGGALRRYLDARHELPERSMSALMPISVRPARRGVTAPGNQVGGAPVSLCTDIADPLRRLHAVHAEAVAAKGGAAALGSDFLKQVMDEMPHPVAEAILSHIVLPQVNVTVSNLRGPDVPLFVAGARLASFYPLNVLADHLGLSHTAFSYDDRLWISMVACRNALDDPAAYADCMRASFDDLVAASAAAAAAAEADAAETGAAGKTRRRARSVSASSAPATRRERKGR